MHAYPNVDNGPSNAICRKLGMRLLRGERVRVPERPLYDVQRLCRRSAADRRLASSRRSRARPLQGFAVSNGVHAARSPSQVAIGRTASGPSTPGGGARRPSRRSRASRAASARPRCRRAGRGRTGGSPPSGWGTTSRRSALPGSSDKPSGGRSIDSRARPKTSRSRSSSRGPQRSRSWRPNARSSCLSAIRRAVAPVAGRGRPARRGRRRRSGTAAGRRRRRARSRTAATRRGAGRRAAPPAPDPAGELSAASPRFAPRPMYARTRRTVDAPPMSLDSAACHASPSSSSTRARTRAGPLTDAGEVRAGRTPNVIGAGSLDAGASDVDDRRTTRGAVVRRALRERRGRRLRRPRRPRLGQHPARPAADRRRSSRPPRGRPGRPSRTTGSRPTSSRSPARPAADGPAGPRVRQRAATLAPERGRLRGRATCAALAAPGRPRRTARPGPPRRAGGADTPAAAPGSSPGPRAALAGESGRPRDTRARARRRRAAPPRGASPGWSGRPPRERGPWSRSAASGRARPSSDRSARASGCCSTATARRPRPAADRARRRRPGRQPGPAGPPVRRRRAELAGRRGPLRERSAARRTGSPIRGSGR